MTPVETIGALASGAPVVGISLAPACRARAYGAEAFGPAAIAELFARHPRPLSPTPAVIAGERTLSLCDADAEGREQGWFADLHEGLIVRLWRVGDGETDDAEEPAQAFATDVFLTQARESFALRAEDHPDLSAHAGAALAQVAAAAAVGPEPEQPRFQARALVLRALSSGDRGSALICAEGPGAPPRLLMATFRFVSSDVVHARLVWDALRPAETRFSV